MGLFCLCSDSQFVRIALFMWISLIMWINAATQERKMVDLLNTYESDSLNWTRFPLTDTLGWKEFSYTGDDDAPHRIYGACDVEKENVNSWIRTPYIEKHDAKRLWVDITFTMRKCLKHPSSSSVRCKETMNLLYYEADSDMGRQDYPAWDISADSYKHIDTIAAHSTWTDRYDKYMNAETLSLSVSHRGVYFAFQDTGACVAIYRIRVYYITCPAITFHFARFPETPTGPNLTSIELSKGDCVDNAEEVSGDPTYLCKGDGTWTYVNAGCHCRAGYEPASSGSQKCLDCPNNKYKASAGNTPCRACPRHSTSRNPHATVCPCDRDYFRAPDETPDTPCSKSPTAPRNVKITDKTPNSLTVEWRPPADLGGRTDTKYTLTCEDCSSTPCVACQGASYDPSRTLVDTKVKITRLSASSNYRVTVTAENGVSGQDTRQPASGAVEDTTQASVPSRVENLRSVSTKPSSIELEWSGPSSGPAMTDFEVRYAPVASTPTYTHRNTRNTRYTLEGLEASTDYIVKVRGRTASGWSEAAEIRETTARAVTVEPPADPSSSVQSNSREAGVIAGAIVAAVVFLIVVIGVIIFLVRRSRNNCADKPVNGPDSHYNHVSTGGSEDSASGTYAAPDMTVPLFPPSLGLSRSTKIYVDPHTYEDPNQAVREFTREIDAACIVIESVIGGGEFGDVCKGRLRIPNRKEKIVAIKTLKPGASDKNRLDFLTEASIMGQFNNQNVIYLEGVVTKSNPIMIVTEYMENGSLDVFLRNNDGKCTPSQLLGMLKGIAFGMGYLSEMGYVHRDLAARNILVDEQLNCKVADFGLSREVENDTTDGAYTTKGGKIPVRWTAPEAIAYRKFTTASDVWSFGVVMWEVISYGERPYWNWSNQDVIRAVDKGYRLPPPMDCPESVYQLMLDCWQKERNHRPRFNAIVKTLEKLIRSPDLLAKLAKPRSIGLLDPSQPDVSRLSGVAEWLAALKMDRYTEAFLAHGVTTLQQASRLTPHDLQELGVTLVGHQKKILNSIQALCAQQYSHSLHMAQGFLV